MVNYGLRITSIICRSKWFDIYIYNNNKGC